MLHTSDGRPVYVEAPTGSGSIRGFTLIGAPSWEWFGTTSLTPLTPNDSVGALRYARLLKRQVKRFGFRIDSTGLATAITSDTSDRNVYRPTLVPLHRHAPAILWIERDSEPAVSPVTLWHSVVNEKYANAHRIWSGSQLNWDGAQAAYNASRTVALFAVPFFRTGFGGGLLFIRLDSGGVQVREVPRDGLPDHASVVSLEDSGRRWLIVYSASDPTSAVSNGTHLFSAAFSWDTGLASTRRIQWSGMEHASHPLLSRVGTSQELRLAWTLSVRASSGGDSLAGWVSRDLGATWEVVDQIALPGHVTLLTAAHVGGAPIYAALLSGRTGTSLSVVLHSSNVLRAIPLPVLAVASAPQWIQLEQQAELLWGATRHDVQYGSAPVTAAARFALHCTP